jgi:hypothetical protein
VSEVVEGKSQTRFWRSCRSSKCQVSCSGWGGNLDVDPPGHRTYVSRGGIAIRSFARGEREREDASESAHEGLGIDSS